MHNDSISCSSDRAPWMRVVCVWVRKHMNRKVAKAHPIVSNHWLFCSFFSLICLFPLMFRFSHFPFPFAIRMTQIFERNVRAKTNFSGAAKQKIARIKTWTTQWQWPSDRIMQMRNTQRRVIIIMKNELRIVSFHLRMLWHFVFVFSLHCSSSASHARSSTSTALFVFLFFSKIFVAFPFDFSFLHSSVLGCDRRGRRCRSHHFIFYDRVTVSSSSFDIDLILFQSNFIEWIDARVWKWSTAGRITRSIEGQRSRINWIDSNAASTRRTHDVELK